MSDGVMQSLSNIGIDDDLSDRQKGREDDRYIAVSE
jgi:hypothetical protein